jgi:hypothetical protein
MAQRILPGRGMARRRPGDGQGIDGLIGEARPRPAGGFRSAPRGSYFFAPISTHS